MNTFVSAQGVFQNTGISWDGHIVCKIGITSIQRH